MSRFNNVTANSAGWAAANASPQARTDFIHKTYQHVALAIAAFIGLEALLLQAPGIEGIIGSMVGGMGWLLVLGAFMFVSWIAQRWATNVASPGMQYLGLGLFVVAEAVLFLPLLYVASHYSDASVIPTAGLITGVTFAGLTATGLISKRDFSFLGGILRIAGFAALGFIIASILFSFSLGTLFAFGMAVFAGVAVVYETSNVLHRYRTDQHVAASLALFAAVALLFWYVLRLVMASDRD